MKRLIVIVSLFAVFIVGACKKNPISPEIPPKPLKELLIGKWKWMKNEGEVFDANHNTWGKLGEEDYSLRDCYQEFKTDGNGLEHFVNLTNVSSDRIFIWSIKDEKSFFFKSNDNAITFTYNVLAIDEHRLIFASEGLVDPLGRTVRGVFYFTK